MGLSSDKYVTAATPLSRVRQDFWVSDNRYLKKMHPDDLQGLKPKGVHKVDCLLPQPIRPRLPVGSEGKVRQRMETLVATW